MRVEVRLGQGRGRRGWEDRVALPSQACPAPAPSLPTARGCDKTCQTSSRARTKWQSPELQGRWQAADTTSWGQGGHREALLRLLPGHTGTAPGPGWVLTAELLHHPESGTAGTLQTPVPTWHEAWPLPSAPGYYHSSCQCREGKRPRTHVGNMTGGRKIREKGHTDTCPPLAQATRMKLCHPLPGRYTHSLPTPLPPPQRARPKK